MFLISCHIKAAASPSPRAQADVIFLSAQKLQLGDEMPDKWVRQECIAIYTIPCVSYTECLCVVDLLGGGAVEVIVTLFGYGITINH